MQYAILITLILASSNLLAKVALEDCLGASLWESTQRKLESIGVGKCRALPELTLSDDTSLTMYAVCNDKGMFISCMKRPTGLIHVTGIEVNSDYADPKNDVDESLAKSLARELVPLVHQAFHIECSRITNRDDENLLALNCRGTEDRKHPKQWSVYYSNPNNPRFSLPLKKRNGNTGFKIQIH